MKAEQKNVASYELSSRLEQLGFPQNSSCFYWVKPDNGYYPGFEKEELYVEFSGILPEREDEKIEGFKILIAAPSAEELGSHLPDDIINHHCFLYIQKGFESDLENNRGKTFWLAGYRNSRSEYSDTLANAMAKILIWLVENGHINFNEK
jgi:hypothetical protein